jgi:hypothetical protein
MQPTPQTNSSYHWIAARDAGLFALTDFSSLSDRTVEVGGCFAV